jgi:hypothetical protein
MSTLLALPPDYALADHIVTFYNLKPYWEKNGQLWEFCCSVSPYLQNTPFWDREWDRTFPPGSAVPLLINLMIIAVGIGVAWKENRWAGLAPLAIHLGYSASVALARISGWRFILPADWIVLMYFAIGLAQITLWTLAYLFRWEPDRRSILHSERVEGAARKSSAVTATAILITMFIVITGATPVLIENLTPTYFTQQRQIEIETVGQMAVANLGSDLIDNKAVQTFTGRALYPRYYPAGPGEPNAHYWPAYQDFDFGRLGFMLIGPSHKHFIIPLDLPPAHFPNNVDVWVAACPIPEQELVMQAAAVVIQEGEKQTIIFPDEDHNICPLP